jgi:hypothetical protein
VAADDTVIDPGATGLRLRWLVVIVAIMALLTAGWPLLNASVANRHALAAGTHLKVGASLSSSAQVTVGNGWSELPAQTNPRYEYMLRRGAVRLSITYVALAGSHQVPQLWSGLRAILRISNPGASLGGPANTVRAHGYKAVSGRVVDNRMVGTVIAVAAPSGRYAIEMITLAPRGVRPAMRVAALRIMRSLLFAGPLR